jgi:hypothetical protein
MEKHDRLKDGGNRGTAHSSEVKNCSARRLSLPTLLFDMAFSRK